MIYLLLRYSKYFILLKKEFDLFEKNRFDFIYHFYTEKLKKFQILLTDLFLKLWIKSIFDKKYMHSIR